LDSYEYIGKDEADIHPFQYVCPSTNPGIRPPRYLFRVDRFLNMKTQKPAYLDDQDRLLEGQSTNGNDWASRHMQQNLPRLK